jgi:hypothetical protein
MYRFSGGFSALDGLDMVCPIVKRTSIPTSTNDRIYNVSLTGGLGSLSCNVVTYEVNPASTSSTNVIAFPTLATARAPISLKQRNSRENRGVAIRDHT